MPCTKCSPHFLLVKLGSESSTSKIIGTKEQNNFNPEYIDYIDLLRIQFRELEKIKKKITPLSNICQKNQNCC